MLNVELRAFPLIKPIKLRFYRFQSYFVDSFFESRVCTRQGVGFFLDFSSLVRTVVLGEFLNLLGIIWFALTSTLVDDAIKNCLMEKTHVYILNCALCRLRIQMLDCNWQIETYLENRKKKNNFIITTLVKFHFKYLILRGNWLYNTNVWKKKRENKPLWFFFF